MFDSMFPSHWTTLRKLMWLKLKGASAVWETISGNPVSFTALSAPLRKLSIAFSPVQDLNGYDAPWPAGGGKNKLQLAGRSKYDGEYFAPTATITVPIGSYLAGYAASGYFVPTNEPTGITISERTVSGVASAGWYGIGFPMEVKPNSTYVASWASAIGRVQASYWDDTSNFISYTSLSTTSPATFTTPATAKYAIVVVATGASGESFSVTDLMVEEGSSASTSYAPYSNICPISGWDSLTVEQRGKNLLDPAKRVQAAHTVARWYQADGFLLRAGVTYTLSADTQGTTVYIINKETDAPIKSGYTATYTPTVDILVYFSAYLSSGIANVNIQLELGSTATAYVPYNPASRSISISLGSTYYSGWVDVISGQGDGDMDSVDMGTLDWYYTNNSGMWPVWLFFAVVPNTVNGFKRLCSIYPLFEGSMGNAPDKTMILMNNKVVYIRDDSYTDAATFKTAMSGVQLVYELSTPIPFQLTPQEINSLAGDNVMFTPCDSLTVEYRSN